jgi:hypothetical protein
MNILNYLGGIPSSAKEPVPTDLEIALARIHSDHTTAMVAIKLLTESVQSSASGNLDMVVVHEERHKALLKNMKELKQEMYQADKRHFAAFELSLRPVLRAVEELSSNIDKVHAVLVEKLNKMDADIHALRVDLNCDREAQARIQNTKLNAIAERIDDLCKALAKDPLAPPKKKMGRRHGSKNRAPEAREAFLVERLERCISGSQTQKRLQFLLNELRAKRGLAK